MMRAGISGIGIISALGRNAAETAVALYADTPKLPALPTRFETKLSLPVFEIPDPEPGAPTGMPLHFLRAALKEALGHAKLTPEMLRSRRVGIAVGTTVACQLDNISCHERLRNGDRSDLLPVVSYITGIPAEYLRRSRGDASARATTAIHLEAALQAVCVRFVNRRVVVIRLTLVPLRLQERFHYYSRLRQTGGLEHRPRLPLQKLGPFLVARA